MKRFELIILAVVLLGFLGAGCCLVNPASHSDEFITGLELNSKTSNTLKDALVPLIETGELPLSDEAKKKDDPLAWEKKHLIALLNQHSSHARTLAEKGGGFAPKKEGD